MEVSKRQLQDEEVTAYHGGPHSFDKFSTQYMKTGEGNQSFGWGLYFTDLEDVAKYYAETIADDSTKIWDKIKEIFNKELGTSFIKNFNYFIIKDIQSRKINIKQAINRLKNANTKLRNISDERMAELFNKALNLETQKKYIYKVTLHKGKTPEQYTWLEWNKPLIQRQKDLILNNLPNNPAKKNKVENLKNNINKNGLEIYQMLSDIFNSDKEASLFLLRIGIDGIKYPTGTLSSALNNTSGFNYVVFDENAVTIEKQTQLQENYTPTDVDVLFKQNPDLEKSVYAILGYNKEIDDKNYEVRKAKYAAQNKIMSNKQVSFANGRGLDRTIRELRNINTPESNIVADLIEVERVNIKAKQFNTKTDDGKLKSKEQYDIKNRLLDNVFKQYRKNGWDVKYERSSIPGVAHTLFFTIPDTDIQLSYHGNYENISKYFGSLPEGRWDGIPGATFHKLEEAALDIINENNMDKTDWRKGIDLGQEFIQLPYTYTEQQKQEAKQIYSEYLQNNPEGDLEGFKEYINSKNLQLETMEISKKDLENQKLINQAHKDITRTKGKDYAPDVHEIQKWLNNPKKLKDDSKEITKGELEEAKKKKADRCLRIAKRKYDVWPSAYASGAVVKCRQGKIWKGLKEEDENFGSDDINLSGHKNYKGLVIVHRNLNKPPYFSIKESNGGQKIGKVIGYDTSILLKDVKFVILKGGQERVRNEKSKNVHAGTVGKIVSSGDNYDTNGWTLVTYNPYTDNTFIEKETGEPIYKAKEAVLKNTREIWVKKEDSLNEEETKKGKIRFEHEHLDHYDGQDNYELGIYEDDNIIGYVQYVIFENEITVSDILVRPNRRREGFGSMLIKKMKQLHPYAKYKPSLKTDLGSKFIHKDVDVNEAKKTDFSKEKEQGLHGWFARQGGKGKSKGWVDCNTCRDGKCKSCGRKEGESRSKYPACRPTPSACKTKGKGDSWGKKSANEDVLNEQSKQDIERELKLNEIKNTFKRLIN